MLLSPSTRPPTWWATVCRSWISWSRKSRASSVWTTRQPATSPPWTTGTPRKETNRSSPVAGRNLKRGWRSASSTATARPRSTTDPTSPSPGANRGGACGLKRRPVLAARTSSRDAGSVR